jgi:hypothetical protein
MGQLVRHGDDAHASPLPGRRIAPVTILLRSFSHLLLTIIRGIDVVGAYGHSPARLTSIAESAFALLPRPHHR